MSTFVPCFRLFKVHCFGFVHRHITDTDTKQLTFVLNLGFSIVFVLAFCPGSVLEKKLTGGLGLFFGSEIFDILIFLGLENLSYFLGLKIFHLFFFLGNNFDTIYFWDVRLNDLDLQNHSNNKINE